MANDSLTVKVEMNEVATTKSSLSPNEDDWETAIDSGEFDKRIEQQEKARKNEQQNEASLITGNSQQSNDQPSDIKPSKIGSNGPIRILKRPPSQPQINGTYSVAAPANNNSNNYTTSPNNSQPVSPSPNNGPVVSIIRNTVKSNPSHSSSSNSTSTNSKQPPIKTYEQRELEYRLARLRIMGTEQDENAEEEKKELPLPIMTDEPNKSNNSTTRTKSQTQSFGQSNSTPGSYASDLFQLNNGATINLIPAQQSTTFTTSSNFLPQHHYSIPYQPATTTTTLYLTSTAPFITSPVSSTHITQTWQHRQQ
ncbi:unnamed protein product [Didymodactylos carnosus]|uniref:SUZ domain-containing protein n=1 Tax=Didymodactylos carnosus TaxID=1234261 RepID=A0A814QXG2_9BILA|nr:unnamed protein product [Didymodactylos carnosus]CAF1125917.1 unnamed protein product [Didymodactylos carnosus]CAF3649341.1 unnamed protein product [Didymodactylos carnosus]CAF3889454.1 unnamed protein product [Didymodactylos carnosus]